jgi:hypothetical protein
VNVFLHNKIVFSLVQGETQLLRIFFALASFGFGWWIHFDADWAQTHTYALALAGGNVHFLAVLYFVHGCALIYGVATGRYSVPLLFVEAILGWALWFVMGVAEAAQQNAVGPMLLSGGMISTLLLIRYPTHHEGSR